MARRRDLKVGDLVLCNRSHEVRGFVKGVIYGVEKHPNGCLFLRSPKAPPAENAGVRADVVVGLDDRSDFILLDFDFPGGPLGEEIMALATMGYRNG
jgi:hypothetical protein